MLFKSRMTKRNLFYFYFLKLFFDICIHIILRINHTNLQSIQCKKLKIDKINSFQIRTKNIFFLKRKYDVDPSYELIYFYIRMKKDPLYGDKFDALATSHNILTD